jgi:uncharacterized protein YjbI with pentapeptide repeats
MADEKPPAEKPKRTLTPANENPWYCLMTLHGEQKEGANWWDFDRNLHAKNRRDWNKWAARALSEEQRTGLLAAKDSDGKPRFTADELTPHTEAEWAQLAAAFQKRMKRRGAQDLPAPTDMVACPDTLFERPLILAGYLFPSSVDLRGATFSGYADLSGATFSGDAYLSGATFSGDAYLSGATFSGYADLSGATFSGNAFLRGTTFSDIADLSGATFSDIANLSGATFSGHADLSGATFSVYADLSGATFSGNADLSGATFSGNAELSGATFSKKHIVQFDRATFAGETTFLNAEMEGDTSFAGARFLKHPPKFHGAKLNEGVAFHGVQWPDPPSLPAATMRRARLKEREKRNPRVIKNAKEMVEQMREAAQNHVYNYQRLKQIMEGLKKHSDELDFFAMEMRAQQVVDGGWRSARGFLNGLYGWTSDYGRSIIGPMTVVGFIIFACFVALVACDECVGGACHTIPGGEAFSLSVTSELLP